MRIDALDGVVADEKIEEDVPSEEAMALVRAAQGTRSAADTTREAYPIGTRIEGAYAGGDEWFPGKVRARGDKPSAACG